MTQQTKRHHFVPRAYLKAWTNEKGRLLVYRKDEPTKPLPVAPDNGLFRTYYYSQPRPDGGQDNNGLEQIFSDLESAWPPLVAAMERYENVNDRLETLIQFTALQRVRVPAARDAAESVLAESVRAQLASMIRSGDLPPAPEKLGDLGQAIDISIDPHQSIHAMPVLLKGVGEMLDRVGLTIVHNTSGRDFLTSDNPVLWFDPGLPFDEQRPYTVDPDSGEIFLIFPVSPTLAIFGARDYREHYLLHGAYHSTLESREGVDAINAQISRFGYECVIARRTGHEDEILRFASTSPIHEAMSVAAAGGLVQVHRQVFGPRRSKPKWQPR